MKSTPNCTKCIEEKTQRHIITQVSILAIILLIGILFNVKTFFVIVKQKRNGRKAVTIFLLNLTLTSGLMVFLLIPFNIYTIIVKRWVFGHIFCQINGFTSVFLCTNTVLTLLCMTIDRYFSVTKPFEHRIKMTKPTALRMLVAVYMAAALLAIIPVFGEAAYEYHSGTDHCSPAWHKSRPYYLLVSFLGFIAPISGMFVTYTRIFLKVRSNRSRTGQSRRSVSCESRASTIRIDDARPHVSHDETRDSPAMKKLSREQNTPVEVLSNNERRNTQSERRQSRINSVIRQMKQQTRLPQEYRIARVGFMLVLSFTLLWLPYLIAHTCFDGACPEGASPLYSISMVLVYMNAIANPIIYGLTNRTVIREFKAHFTHLCRCRVA